MSGQSRRVFKRSELQNLGDYMGKSYSEWDFDVVVIGAGEQD